LYDSLVASLERPILLSTQVSNSNSFVRRISVLYDARIDFDEETFVLEDDGSWV
jgi:hypothetical protein